MLMLTRMMLLCHYAMMLPFRADLPYAAPRCCFDADVTLLLTPRCHACCATLLIHIVIMMPSFRWHYYAFVFAAYRTTTYIYHTPPSPCCAILHYFSLSRCRFRHASPVARRSPLMLPAAAMPGFARRSRRPTTTLITTNRLLFTRASVFARKTPRDARSARSARRGCALQRAQVCVFDAL